MVALLSEDTSSEAAPVMLLNAMHCRLTRLSVVFFRYLGMIDCVEEAHGSVCVCATTCTRVRV